MQASIRMVKKTVHVKLADVLCIYTLVAVNVWISASLSK